MDLEEIFMKCAIAVFAKTIGLSPVKTRLAAGIGQTKAEEFYRVSVSCIEAVLQKVAAENSYTFPHWVLAEEEGPARFESKSFPASWTGNGRLGDRLAKVSQRFLKNHDAVILVGTDSPQMAPNQILEIVGELGNNRPNQHVVGPATDGGFWLWGSREAMPLEVWQNVAYSAETTLEELIKATKDHGHSVSMGHELQDVDVFEDLATLQLTLEQKGSDLLSAQANLLKWLQENTSTFQG